VNNGTTTSTIPTTTIATASTTTKKRIGVVQRQHKRANFPNRVFVNVEEIEAALVREFSSIAQVGVTTLAGMSLREQARYFYDQDVVVMAHGAAVTNAIFCDAGKRASIVEIYPDGYAPYMFQAMIQSCRLEDRVRATADVVSNSSNKTSATTTGLLPAIVQHYRMTTNTSVPRPNVKRYNPRDVDLNPKVEAVVDLVRRALVGQNHHQAATADR